jgi:DNA primase
MPTRTKQSAKAELTEYKETVARMTLERYGAEGPTAVAQFPNDHGIYEVFVSGSAEGAPTIVVSKVDAETGRRARITAQADQLAALIAISGALSEPQS